MATGLAIQAGAIVLTVMILGIIMGYTGGIGMDLTSGITDLTWQNKTTNFIIQSGDLGFGILKFNYLVALGLVAFAVLGVFISRQGGL